MSENWSGTEVKEIVADYFNMLLSELQGKNYNKASHRRELQQKLNDRSHGSIERKHQNISAVLIELGLPYISGYKPLRNYQRLLLPDIIENHISDNPKVLEVIAADVEKSVIVPSIEDILNILVDPPKHEETHTSVFEPSMTFQKKTTNYLAREAYNQTLGKSGEQFVMHYEQARLIYSGHENLADKIEQVSITQGDGLGFDIHSYELNGHDRFIEVKTTKYGKSTPFFITANELSFSEQHRKQYHLYRLFDFKIKPGLFSIPGCLSENFILSPTEYMAKL